MIRKGEREKGEEGKKKGWEDSPSSGILHTFSSSSLSLKKGRMIGSGS